MKKPLVVDLIFEDWCIMGPSDRKAFWIIPASVAEQLSTYPATD